VTPGYRLSAVVLAALPFLSSPAPRATAADAPKPGAGREMGVPAEGLDRVRLDDGRVLSCRLDDPKARDGKVTLNFGTFAATLHKDRILEVRRFADYDSTPRSDDEKALAARGQIRFAGRWMPKERADAVLKAEQDAARKFREEDDFHGKWDNRWQIDTDHFHIEANIPRDGIDFYAERLEAFYDFFTRAFQIQLTQRERKKKLPVFLFRRRDEFRKFCEADMGGKTEHLLGYFVNTTGRERLVFFDIADSRQDTLDVMFHEGTHFILHLTEPQVIVSTWVNEGCAEYFGASTFDGKRFTPGPVQDGRLLYFQDMIRTNRVLDMDNLLRAGNPFAEGDTFISFLDGEHYAQAWTLVHFLMEGKKGKYRAGFIGYLNRMLLKKMKLVAIAGSEQKYVSQEEAKAELLRALGLKEFGPLMAELKEYAMALPLRSAAAYVERAERRLYESGDMAGAEADFRTALEKGKDDPAALAGVARAIRYVPGREAEAADLFRKALTMDPLNTGTRMSLSRLLAPPEALAEVETCLQIDPDYGYALAEFARLTYAVRVTDHDRAREDEMEAVRKGIAAAERAIALDPSDHAYDALAALCLVCGDFEKARDAEKAAVEIEPERLDYLWRLAECYALVGQPDDFARILRRVELLLRRESQPKEGETANENAMTPEQIQDTMAVLVRRMAEHCLTWKRTHEAAVAMECWYQRRVPKSEDDWVFYSTVLRLKGDPAKARKVAADGLAAFPGSDALKALSVAADEPEKKDEGLGSGGGLGGGDGK
jgi:tetratricopeptide (TPR) repeat protein